MISFRKAASDLDRLDELKRAALRCYGLAIRTTDEYAIEVDRSQVARLRTSLQALAGQLRSAETPAELQTVHETFSTELRSYKQEAEQLIRQLQKDVEAAAAAMDAFAGNLKGNSADYEVELKREIQHLNTAAAGTDLPTIRGAIRSATAAIAASFEQMRLTSELAIGELKDEIRQLQVQARTAEKPARTPARNPEMVAQIEQLMSQALSFPILLVVVRNLKVLEATQPASLVEMALNSMQMRFRGLLNGKARMGRMSHDQFIAILDSTPINALAISREVAGQLSQAYILQEKGQTRTLTLQVRAGVVDHRAGGDPTKFYPRLDRLAEALANA